MGYMWNYYYFFRKVSIGKVYIRYFALLVSVIVILTSMETIRINPAGAAIVNRGPIGWEVFRNPLTAAILPIGVHTHQTASTDPHGLNHDNYHCQRILPQHACLLAEASGAGEIDAIWTTRHDDLIHTGNLTVILDGITVLHAPLKNIVNGGLGAPFVYPIVANARQSSGGNYIIAPMTYHNSMQIFTEHDPEYYHVTYRSFDNATAVPTFNPHDAARDVIQHLLSPQKRVSSRKIFQIEPQEKITVADIPGSGILRQWNLSIPDISSMPANQISAILQEISLIIKVDGIVSVNVPLRQFFGASAGDTLVKSVMFRRDPDNRASYTSFWPIPFASRITMSLVNHTKSTIHGAAAFQITHDSVVAVQLAQHGLGYFRVDTNSGNPQNGKDFEFFSTGGRGKFLGFIAQLKGNANHLYLEGNEHIYYNGSLYPQIDGTGTEDLFEAGWYFFYGPFSNPLNGETFHGINGQGCSHNAECISAYRIYLSDAVPFEHGIRAAIQHGPTNNVFAHYRFTNFWYSTQP